MTDALMMNFMAIVMYLVVESLLSITNLYMVCSSLAMSSTGQGFVVSLAGCHFPCC